MKRSISPDNIPTIYLEPSSSTLVSHVNPLISSEVTAPLQNENNQLTLSEFVRVKTNRLCSKLLGDNYSDIHSPQEIGPSFGDDFKLLGMLIMNAREMEIDTYHKLFTSALAAKHSDNMLSEHVLSDAIEKLKNAPCTSAPFNHYENPHTAMGKWMDYAAKVMNELYMFGRKDLLVRVLSATSKNPNLFFQGYAHLFQNLNLKMSKSLLQARKECLYYLLNHIDVKPRFKLRRHNFKSQGDDFQAWVNQNFYEAIKRGQTEKAILSLFAGADFRLNCPIFDIDYGKPAMHILIDKDNSKMIRALMFWGYAIDSKDKNGHTALSYACKHKKVSIVRLLIEEGANLYSLNAKGKTPYMLAMDKANKTQQDEFKLIESEYMERLVVKENLMGSSRLTQSVQPQISKERATPLTPLFRKRIKEANMAVGSRFSLPSLNAKPSEDKMEFTSDPTLAALPPLQLVKKIS